MKKRIEYRGGAGVDRLIADKLKSLKRALKLSYHSATAVFSDGREFHCLINPSKVVISEDIKIFSIPYKDICLNAEKPEQTTTTKGEVDTNVSIGQIIEWKETGTHWLIYNQHLEEAAYFRGDLRRCDYEVSIGGKKYWAYFQGPGKQILSWQNKEHEIYNKVNETGLMYLPNTEELRATLKRFVVLEINGEPWEVQNVDSVTNPGLMTVTVKEHYKNSVAAAQVQVEQSEPEEVTGPRIIGAESVYPYETYEYLIEGATGGEWQLSNAKAKFTMRDSLNAAIEITTGKSGQVTLSYVTPLVTYVKNIVIQSL